MNRIIKTLIRDSIRNCSVLQKYNVIQSHVYFSEDALACIANETNKTNPPRIASEIRNTIKDMIQIHESINWKDAVNILFKLDIIFKQQKPDYTELKKLEELTYLFKIIYGKIRFLSTYDIIRVLKILVEWNVPHQTMLVQTLLQLISIHVNDLSIRQIIKMHNLVHKIQRCELTKSLDIALCHVFKEKAVIEIHSENTNLVTAFMFAISIGDKKSANYIIKIITPKLNDLQVSDVILIYTVLHDMPKTKHIRQLFVYMIKRIRDNSTNLTLNNITFLLNFFCKSYLNNTMKFHDENLISTLYHSTFKNNFTFHDNITVLKYLNIMRYSCDDFLMHLTESCIKDKDNIDKSPLEDIIHFIEGFVIADYELSGWKPLKVILIEYVTNADCSLPKAVSIIFSLLSLDCYDSKLLNKVFTLYNKATIINNQTALDILKLYWCAKILYSTPNNVLPDESKLNEIKIGPEQSHTSCLMKSLKEACGSDKYVKGGLKTKWGLLIDNIVVKQPDGSLMDISKYDNITFIEELASLSECDKILFIALKKEAYSSNLKKMLSTVKIQLRAIKQLPGYHVFVVDPFLWENLLDEEKLAHLQQAINNSKQNDYNF